MLTPQTFYQAGGSLSGEFQGYVSRRADEELYTSLKAGAFCYVLTARQMGKSSLKVRTMQRLRADGWNCVDIDITAFGSQDADAEQWYYSFLYEIADAIGRDEAFDDWWETKHRFTPVARMSAFWAEIVCEYLTEPLVMFIDEIDSLLNLQQFSSDDFFAAIRALYNHRTEDPRFRQLHFCIIGVSTPQDLIQEATRTPFNVGTPIRLQNFTLEEAEPLAAGLSHLANPPAPLLAEIIAWTGGQPYLTQRLCRAVSRHEKLNTSPKQFVRKEVERLFLSAGSVQHEMNLNNVQRRILEDQEWNTRMLSAYDRILQQGKIPVNYGDPIQLHLRLTGLVREAEGHMVVNNAIFESVFDRQWIQNAWGRVLRPFSADIKRWIENDQHEDFLLRGKVLDQAVYWAKDREDLSKEERDFLDGSREREQQRRERRLNEERRQEALAHAEERLAIEVRARRRQRLLTAVIGAVAMVAIGASGYAYKQFKTVNKQNQALENNLFNIHRGKARELINEGAYTQAVAQYQEALKHTTEAMREDSAAVVGRMKGVILFQEEIAEADRLVSHDDFSQALAHYRAADSMNIRSAYVQRKMKEVVQKRDKLVKDKVELADISYKARHLGSTYLKQACQLYREAQALVPGDQEIQRKLRICEGS